MSALYEKTFRIYRADLLGREIPGTVPPHIREKISSRMCYAQYADKHVFHDRTSGNFYAVERVSAV